MRLALPNRIEQPNENSPMIDWALWWASQGWPVFPLRPRSKEPYGGSNGVKSATTDEDTIRGWWRDYPNSNVGGATTGRVVFDDDSGLGMGLPTPLPDTLEFETGTGNTHWVYLAQPGTQANELSIGARIFGAESPHEIDIRAGAGGYIVLPGSTHPNGSKYRVRHPREEATLTDSHIDQLLQAGAKLKGFSRRVTTEGTTLRVANGRASLLTDLLSNPPAQGGRNSWLTEVSGHYARNFRWAYDVYQSHVAIANNLLDEPLDDNERDKVAQSVWETEQREHPEREATSDSGWLVGNGTERIQVMYMDRSEKEPQPELCEFCNFSLEALGVDRTEEDLEYLCRITVDGVASMLVLRGADFDTRKLTAILAGRGASIAPTYEPVGQMAPGIRLLRYLNSQNPPAMSLVEHLGWSDQASGYIVPGGVVTAAGMVGVDKAAGAIADPGKVKGAPYAYGFDGDEQVARDVLNEVLTFQDSELTSVYGSWWAAVLAKQWVIQYVGSFPFLAVDAASESGKTNGFFGLMHQLSGATNTGSVATLAAARNNAAQNSNGIVWIDDMDDTSKLGELLRAATSQGELIKSNAENTGTASFKIVSAMQISGENLPYNQDKALRDRSVVLEPQNPTGRRSRHGDWLQWEDVLKVKRTYPDDRGGLSVLSGWMLLFVIRAQQQGVLEVGYQAAREVRRKGRRGAADEVLVMGAHLLAHMTGDPEHIDRVRRFVDRSQQGAGGDEFQNENALTLRILPEVIRELGFPRQARESERPSQDGWKYTPAFITGTEDMDTLLSSADADIRFHTPTLASYWRHLHRGRQSAERTETSDALTKQATVLGCSRVKQRVADAGESLHYRRLTGPVAAEVLRRARDES